MGTNENNVNEHRIENAHEYLERLAFGFNDDDTCSAISMSLALNYLSLQYGRDFVPQNRRAERLNASVPSGALDIRGNYPGTYALHRYFVEECGMRRVSYGDKVTVPFGQYLERMEGIDRGIGLSWTLFPRSATIKTNIDANLPVLFTTTLAGTYSWHTMVCYGYREKSDGSGLELLAHNGWYGPEHTLAEPETGNRFQSGEWVNKRIATYGYYFTLS